MSDLGSNILLQRFLQSLQVYYILWGGGGGEWGRGYLYGSSHGTTGEGTRQDRLSILQTSNTVHSTTVLVEHTKY